MRTAFAQVHGQRVTKETPQATATALGSAAEALAALGYPFKEEVEGPPGLGANNQQEESVKASDEGAVCQADAVGPHLAVLRAMRALVCGTLASGTLLLPVGSFAWGIHVDKSDLDTVLVAPGGGEAGPVALDALFQAIDGDGPELPRCLAGSTAIVRGSGTPFPVLTIRTAAGSHAVSVDVCCAGTLGSIRDAVLFRHMAARSPPLAPVLRLLKRWLRATAMPTACEGGYPQVFWMRLAVRAFQQTNAIVQLGKAGGVSALPVLPGSIGAAKQAIREGAKSKAGKMQEPVVCGEAIAALQALSDQKSEDSVRPLLRSFCSGWAAWLPSYGELLNLEGEDPTPALKRLAAGVFASTTLLCLHEVKRMADAPDGQDLARTPPHKHLCPARPNYWGLFLVPRHEVPTVWQGPQKLQLVVAHVHACRGPTDSVRQCACAACSEDALSKEGGTRDGGAANSTSDESTDDVTSDNSGAGDPDAAGGSPRRACEYLSRKETDWLLWATVRRHAPAPSAEPDGTAARAGHPALSPVADGPDPATRSETVLAPAHFVTTLEGDPLVSATARAELQAFQEVLGWPGTESALPAAYPAQKLSRRALLEASVLRQGERNDAGITRRHWRPQR